MSKSTKARRMKTRDIVKYVFASLLALMTVVAIGGLYVARHYRDKMSTQQETQLRQTLTIYGQNGALPEKVDLPDTPMMSGARNNSSGLGGD